MRPKQIREPAEDERAEDRADEVRARRRADLRLVRPSVSRLAEHGADGADERDLEAVEHPRDAERDDDAPVPPDHGSRSSRPGTSVGNAYPERPWDRLVAWPHVSSRATKAKAPPDTADEAEAFLALDQNIEATVVQGTLPASLVAENGMAEDDGVTLMLPAVRTGLFEPNTVPVDVNEAVPVMVVAFVSVPVSVVSMVSPAYASSMMKPANVGRDRHARIAVAVGVDGHARAIRRS